MGHPVSHFCMVSKCIVLISITSSQFSVLLTNSGILKFLNTNFGKCEVLLTNSGILRNPDILEVLLKNWGILEVIHTNWYTRGSCKLWYTGGSEY